MSSIVRQLFLPVLLLASLFFEAYVIYRLSQRNNELTEALSVANGTITQLQSDIERQAGALAERDTKIAKLNADKSRLNRQLREAATHDTEVKAWADTAVPYAVDRLLRGDSGTAVQADGASASSGTVR